MEVSKFMITDLMFFDIFISSDSCTSYYLQLVSIQFSVALSVTSHCKYWT